MIRAGSAYVSPSFDKAAAARSTGRSFCVNVNTRCRFRVRSLLNAASCISIGELSRKGSIYAYRKVVQRIAPCRPCVVDKDMKNWLFSSKVISYAFYLFILRQIRRKRDTFPGSKCIELSSSLFTALCRTRRDINLEGKSERRTRCCEITCLRPVPYESRSNLDKH